MQVVSRLIREHAMNESACLQQAAHTTEKLKLLCQLRVGGRLVMTWAAEHPARLSQYQ